MCVCVCVCVKFVQPQWTKINPHHLIRFLLVTIYMSNAAITIIKNNLQNRSIKLIKPDSNIMNNYNKRDYNNQLHRIKTHYNLYNLVSYYFNSYL